jgi:hypothetical protein
LLASASASTDHSHSRSLVWLVGLLVGGDRLKQGCRVSNVEYHASLCLPKFGSKICCARTLYHSLVTPPASIPSSL